MTKKTRSKNLKEAKKRFKKACENKDPFEIAIASVEILIYDKKHSNALAHKLTRALKKSKREQEKNKKS